MSDLFQNLWRRGEASFQRLEHLHRQWSEQGDPAGVLFKKQWQKISRLREHARSVQEHEALWDEWMDCARGMTRYLRELAAFDSEIDGGTAELSVPQTAAAGGDTGQIGIYNRALNASQLREWLHNIEPRLAMRLDTTWLNYWSYWLQTRPAPAGSELPDESPAEAR